MSEPSDAPRRSRPRPVLPGGAPLSDRAAATDRAARFDERYARVAETHARRELRRRRIAAVVASVTIGTAGAIGFGVAGPVGLAAAAGATTAGYGALRLAGRTARRRGASAWDWQAQRYRLLGSPADRVQALDRPKEVPPQ